MSENAQRIVPVFTYLTDPIVEPAPTKPWALMVDGASWLFATEGHLLVAVKGDVADGEPTPDKFQKASRYLSEPLELPRSIPFKALAKFAGKPTPADVKCAACDGDGRDSGSDNEVECEHCGRSTRPECGECGGSGTGYLPRLYASIVDGAPFNKPFLAYALSLVPSRDTVTVGRLQAGAGGSGTALLVDGGDWRIAVMSVRADRGAAIEEFVDPASLVPARSR